MKKFKPLIPLIILLVSMGCEKQSPGLPQTPPVVNEPPIVDAGASIRVFLPVDSAFLYGSATDTENNIDSRKWRQLSGPRQAIIQTPDLFKTKISQLIKGEYSFELTVIDKGGLMGKDTANIVVDSLGTNIMIFKNLEAICWGPECTVVVDTSNTNIYRNLPIKVSLKLMDSAVWVEIPQKNYFFSSNGKYFWIEWYGLDDSKKWEVMIVY